MRGIEPGCVESLLNSKGLGINAKKCRYEEVEDFSFFDSSKSIFFVH